jgi:hypothetical protein
MTEGPRLSEPSVEAFVVLLGGLGNEAGLLIQGVRGVPWDPFAPP